MKNRISQCVRMVAPIQKKRKKHLSCVTCHLSDVRCHLSPVTCHQHHQPEPQTLPLLTPLCTVSWFTKTEICFLQNQPIYPKPKDISKLIKLSKPEKRVSQFCNFSDTLFDQKSPVHAVPDPGLGQGTNSQTTLHIHGHHKLQTDLAQEQIQ